MKRMILLLYIKNPGKETITMNKPEEKKSNLENTRKDTAKKVYEKPEKVTEQKTVAGKSACGRRHSCGSLVYSM